MKAVVRKTRGTVELKGCRNSSGAIEYVNKKYPDSASQAPSFLIRAQAIWMPVTTRKENPLKSSQTQALKAEMLEMLLRMYLLSC